MSGMEYGTDEHLDGLSRDALKSEVRWWYGRALEMEAENAKLRELLSEARDELVGMYEYLDGGYAWPSIEDDPSFGPFYKRLCDVLGVEVPE